ncbi:S41 family peptidase [Nonomuraea sp. NBC_01738]|uniref:S41 family peptidase n=1 Tax=Nonomuraea sp. NBC_01738 TaxID=2976003 RepID=UPI002E0DB109|nr:S41 family peptidase [Nonomuraea sp. NBC_01738]
MRALAGGLALLLVAGCTTQTPPRAQGADPAASVCAPPEGPPAAEKPTTVDVVEQAYFCILARYYSGATLDARTLLGAAFVAVTQQLNRDGRDLPEATMPALTGDRKADWAAFEAVFRRITAQTPAGAPGLAATALRAMVDALGDNHARWQKGVGKRPPGYYDGDLYGLGMKASAGQQVAVNPGTALPPLFVTAVLGGPAREAGIRPGDVIESVNGSAPFIGDAVTPGAVAALYPQYPEAAPVRLRVLRERTGQRRTVTLKPGLFQPDPEAMQAVTGKVLAGDVAYVRLSGFSPDAADRVFRTVDRLRENRTLTGMVLDLRGNGGGSPDEANRLLGGFGHGKVTAYQCSVSGTCDTMRTDDTAPLVGLPLVVLTDRGCASACEHFSSAVKDLGLGKLVGTRTAGAVSGPAEPYLLGDNTLISFPSRHHLAPNREVIDKVGVAPDHHVPATARDAAAGRDSALAKALTVLRP